MPLNPVLPRTPVDHKMGPSEVNMKTFAADSPISSNDTLIKTLLVQISYL
jgi:hypothetical protein